MTDKQKTDPPAPLPTIRNLQARIIYAQHDGNTAEALRLKKELEKLK
jgi:hypothetical protein